MDFERNRLTTGTGTIEAQSEETITVVTMEWFTTADKPPRWLLWVITGTQVTCLLFLLFTK